MTPNGAVPFSTATIRRRLALTWIGIAGSVGVLFVAALSTRSPLDDRDPAQQRPGFLDAVGHASSAPRIAPDLPRNGRKVVVFFVRPGVAGWLCSSLSTDQPLRRRADVAVVGPAATSSCTGVATVTDPAGSLARAFGMRRPRDGGPPVGYAVVDSHGLIRYRTLDPRVASALDEVETMVRATP
ncbi:MAG TPA: hypothetical protein VNA57_02800 [Acidimicrobiales bacterium]|nr:hypothetical protein [Acidimicrobiales bacterium]